MVCLVFKADDVPFYFSKVLEGVYDLIIWDIGAKANNIDIDVVTMGWVTLDMDFIEVYTAVSEFLSMFFLGKFNQKLAAS